MKTRLKLGLLLFALSNFLLLPIPTNYLGRFSPFPTLPESVFVYFGMALFAIFTTLIVGVVNLILTLVVVKTSKGKNPFFETWGFSMLVFISYLTLDFLVFYVIK